MKPIAFRMWPFVIRGKSISGCGDGLFQYKGEDYYVYVDGIYLHWKVGRGKTEELYSTMDELIEIWRKSLK